MSIDSFLQPARYRTSDPRVKGFGSTLGSGQSDYVIVPYTKHSQTGLRTYSMWLSHRANVSKSRIIDKRDSGDAEMEQLWISSSGTTGIYLQRRGASANRQFILQSSQWPRAQNKWFHLVAMHDETIINLDAVRWYVDGVRITSGISIGESSGSIYGTNTGRYWIGNRYDHPTDRWFDGYMSQIAAWDRFLTEYEIKKLYLGTEPLEFEKNLVWYAPLDNTNTCWTIE